MDDLSSFPKFQYSRFVKGNRDEQFVIRTNTMEELIEAKKELNKILEKMEQEELEKEPTGGDPIMETTAPYCPIHKTYMLWRKAGISKSGKPYPGFYACPGKKEDGSFCDWKPPKGGPQ